MKKIIFTVLIAINFGVFAQTKVFVFQIIFFLKTSSMVSLVKAFGRANLVYTDSRINHIIGTSLTQKNILKTFALLIAFESMKIR